MNARTRTRLLQILSSAPQIAAYAPIGGQAVIEGVMIRSPRRVATAVLRPAGDVSVKSDPFLSVLKRSAFFRLPIVRGAVGLIESMAVGMKALAYSAEVAAEEERKAAGEPLPAAAATGESDSMSRWAIAGTLTLSLGLGILVFFYVPLLLTELTGVRNPVAFNLIDGVIRLTILLAYLRIISLWGEMRRVFEFHGAEHKAIHNFESGRPLAPETAAEFTRLHPRCGTAFLLTVMLVSIVVFTFFGRPDTIGERLLRLAGIPLIGGLAFEAIRFSGKHWDRAWVRFLSAPGLKLQLLTTREPDLSQLAVAIRAVESVTPLEAADLGEIRVM